jgi:hypothetical protein
LFVSDGNETLLLDPTVGLVVRNTSYDDILSGTPTNDFASFFTAPSPVDTWDMTDFNAAVIHAVQSGLYTPGDATYYYTSLQDFNSAPGSLTQDEAAFRRGVVDSGALPSQTPFESMLSFMRQNTDLFDAAASAVAEQPAIVNEARTAASMGQAPLDFALDAGAAAMGQALNAEAATIASPTVGPAEAKLISSVLVLGGLAAAYDDLTGGDTFQDVADTLTPEALQDVLTASSQPRIG